MKEKKDVPLNIRVDKKLDRKLKKAAEKKGLSKSTLARVAIMDYLGRGYRYRDGN